MKNYRTPVIEVTEFSTENIVTESTNYINTIENYDNKKQLSFDDVSARASVILTF